MGLGWVRVAAWVGAAMVVFEHGRSYRVLDGVGGERGGGGAAARGRDWSVAEALGDERVVLERGLAALFERQVAAVEDALGEVGAGRLAGWVREFDGDEAGLAGRLMGEVFGAAGWIERSRVWYLERMVPLALEVGAATVVGARGTATPVLRGTATGVATGTPEGVACATACGDPFACARATMTAEVRATATEAALHTEVARRVATATPTLTVGQARRTIEARMYLAGRAWLPVVLRSRPKGVEATEMPPCEPGPEPWGCRQATERAQRTRVAAETATAAVTPVPTRCPGLVCPGAGRPGVVAR